VIKIPIMILAYRDAEAGLLDLDERREVTLETIGRAAVSSGRSRPGCSRLSAISCAR